VVDDAFQEIGFGVLVEVDVAYLSDAIALEGWREVADRDGAVDDVCLVARELAGV